MRGFLKIAVLLIAGTARADSLSVADSLRTIRLDTTLTADSLLAVSDSLGRGVGAADRWLLPAGIIALSVAVFYLLFTIRSK
jgi:hypothetical protein